MTGLDDSKVGRAIVRCPGCGEERWYGYGACQTCGAYLPRTKQSDTAGPTPNPSESDDSRTP